MFIRRTEPDPTLEAFRQEVRAFCERELPAELEGWRAEVVGRPLLERLLPPEAPADR